MRTTNRWSLPLTPLLLEEPPHYIPPARETPTELTLTAILHSLHCTPQPPPMRTSMAPIVIFTAKAVPSPFPPPRMPPPSQLPSLLIWPTHRETLKPMTPLPSLPQIKRESLELQYLPLSQRPPTNLVNASTPGDGSAQSTPVPPGHINHTPPTLREMVTRWEELTMNPQLLHLTLRLEMMMEWLLPLLPLRRTSLDLENSGSPLMMEERSGSRVWVELNPPLIMVAINYSGIDLARTVMTITISLSSGAQEN